jgi:hypothetical protein
MVHHACRSEAPLLRLSSLVPSRQPSWFISHIQMLLRLLEYARRIVKAQSAQEVLVSATSDPALRESLDLAEELLDQARRIREGDKPSFHVERCRVQLDALYGDFEVVLQGWNNLLTRQDVYRPPIRRQLVQAYVVRRNRRWDNLDPKEMLRTSSLGAREVFAAEHCRYGTRDFALSEEGS